MMETLGTPFGKWSHWQQGEELTWNRCMARVAAVRHKSITTDKISQCMRLCSWTTKLMTVIDPLFWGMCTKPATSLTRHRTMPEGIQQHSQERLWLARHSEGCVQSQRWNVDPDPILQRENCIFKKYTSCRPSTYEFVTSFHTHYWTVCTNPKGQ